MMRMLVLAGALLVSVHAMGQGMQSDWQAKWANARDYTLAVAEAMPDSLYGYNPPKVGEVKPAMSFGAQLLHLAGNIDWLTTTKLRDGERMPAPDIDATDKAAVMQRVAAMFDQGSAALGELTFAQLDEPVKWFDGSMLSRRRVGLLLFDHVTHHRAQAIMYLRMKGIQAPKYVGW